MTNGVVGMALAYGGLGQLLAGECGSARACSARACDSRYSTTGMWEGATGNTFGFVAFSSCKFRLHSAAGPSKLSTGCRTQTAASGACTARWMK